MKKLVNNLRLFYSQLQTQIAKFLQNALLIFIIWKSIYLIVLLPNRTIDDPLTSMVGTQSVWLLNTIYSTNSYASKDIIATISFEGVSQSNPVANIYKNGTSLMKIADGCNGLELFVLYIGFIIAMPAMLKRKLAYIIFGVFIIHLVNLLRCAGLSVLIEHLQPYFDIAHHYIFKMVIYGIIFLLWIQFSNRLTLFNKADAIV
jgi:exosortase family protein XrtF